MEEWEGVGEGQIERSTSRQAAVNSVNHHTMDTNSNGVYAKSTHAAELPHQVPRRLSDPSPPSVPSTTFGPASAPPQPVVVGENNNDLPAGADKADFSCNNNYDSAIKQLGIGRFHIAIAVTCGYMFLAAGLENNLNAYILSSVHCDLQISSAQMGLLNAAFLVGGISSNFMWGVVADMLGRRTVVVYGMLLDGILTLVSSLSQHFEMLLAFRFLSGFIVGGPASIVFTYMGEFFPDKIRSKVICFVGISWTLSWVIMPSVAWLVIPMQWSVVREGFVFNSWRLLVAATALPCLSSAALLALFPESPRFVLMKGNEQEALNILAKVYSVNSRQSPADYPVKSLQAPAVQPDFTASGQKSVCRPLMKLIHQTVPLFTFPTLTTTFFTSFYLFSNMFGYYGLGLWLPELFNRMSLHLESEPEALVTICTADLGPAVNSTTDHVFCDPTDVDTSVFTKSLIMGLVGLSGNVLSGLLANRLHRRTMPVIFMALSALCVVLLYYTTNIDYNMILASAFQFNVGTANLVYISLIVDMFPPNVSGLGVCVAVLFGRLGAMVSNLVFGELLDVNCSIPVFLVAAVLLAGSVLSFFIPKEPYSEKSPASATYRKQNHEVYVIT